MDLSDSDTRNRGHDTGKEICSFVEEKFSLFTRYLSITERMKEGLNDKEADTLDGILSERQNCINKIEKIDLSLKKIGGEKGKSLGDTFKGLIDGYLKDIKSVMEAVGPLERELMVMVKEEGEGIKFELLKMRKVRQAGRGYRRESGYRPRFLDTVR